MSDIIGQPLTIPVVRMRRNRARKGVINKRAKGFTLIEIVLVLAVGLGLIIGGVVFYRQASENSEYNDAVRRINALSAEVRSQYRNVADWAFLETDASDPLPESPFALRSGLSDEVFRSMVLIPGDTSIWRYRIKLSSLNRKRQGDPVG